MQLQHGPLKKETIRLYQKVEDLNSNSQISKVSGFQNNSQSIIPSLKKFSILLVKMKKFSHNSMKAQYGSVTFCPFSYVGINNRQSDQQTDQRNDQQNNCQLCVLYILLFFYSSNGNVLHLNCRCTGERVRYPQLKVTVFYRSYGIMEALHKEFR